MNKILVCITAQSNSHRLIDKGNEAAQKNNGTLHILHVEKGNDIFKSSDKLLQELFNYASTLGGIVHGLCSDDVVQTIMQFIKGEEITHIVLGEPPAAENIKPLDIDAILRDKMPHLEIIILRRN